MNAVQVSGVKTGQRLKHELRLSLVAGAGPDAGAVGVTVPVAVWEQRIDERTNASCINGASKGTPSTSGGVPFGVAP